MRIRGALLASLLSVTASAAASEAGPTAAVPGDGTVATGDAPASPFRDPGDGSIDLSSWLLDRHGFLPVPIVITDPALGYGGGVALAFFHRPAGAPATRTGTDGKPRMIAPNIMGVMGIGTENGTRAYGAGARLHFREDTWRYRGGLASADLNIDFYTTGRLLPERRIPVNLDGLLSFQQVSRRIGERDLYLSAQWIYMDVDPHLQDAADRPLFTDLDLEQVSSGLGLTLEYDSRDNPFTPSSGYFAQAQANAYLPSIGSDVAFQSYRLNGYGYWPIGNRLVLGGRGDLRSASGDVPFYRLPYIDLRGIPSARYQDDHVAVVEAELRWNFTPRWAAIGFGGAGRAWGSRASFADASTAVSRGIGARYLVARKLGIYVGADYAWGPEDQTVIIQVGSAWR